MTDAKEESFGSPPWGDWRVLLSEPDFKVKRIEVKPGNRLSYQKHFRREEHWQVVRGEGVVTLDGAEQTVTTGACIRIGREQLHRIENRGRDSLVFIEVQRGEYFGEDDIVRVADDYGRDRTSG